MSLRAWISPVVLLDNNLTTKAEVYCTQGFRNWLPINLDGTAAATWAFTAGRAADWTAAEADTTLTDLFAGDLPASINTRNDMLTFLRGRTIGDVPTARRNAIAANLTAFGVVQTDLVLTTPLWKVWQRVVSTVEEKNANFGMDFKF